MLFVCAYLIVGGAGGWSNATCITIISHSAMVTCECNTTNVPVTVIEVL